jgi:hypothetical protein
VEDAVRLTRASHQLIEALGGPGKHERHIPHVQADAFGLAGSSGGVDDLDDVFVFARRRCYFHFRRRRGTFQHSIERHAGSSSRQAILQRLLQFGVVGDQEPWLAVPHHGFELGGGLPRIERHDDDAFGRECQIDDHPANGICPHNRAPVAGLQAETSQVRPRALDLIQKLPACDADELLAANFAQNHSPGAALKLREQIFDKVGHARQGLVARSTGVRAPNIKLVDEHCICSQPSERKICSYCCV